MLKRITGLFFAVFLLGSSAVQAAGLPDFTNLIEKNSLAVVKIETIGNVNSRNAQVPQDIPEIFRHFFDQQQRRQPQQQARSMGSGFVVSIDGYVLTNNHVIDSAEKIVVRFNDQAEYEAEVVGTDPSTDLALLKIEADKDLPIVRFGDSESLKVGSWVVAIGSPFGLDYSASVGIVSAIGRSIPTEQREDFVPFIQTDVAINPGNSGGPLFNLDGEVVGINSQIYTRSGGSNGVSFSIPSHVAKRVVSQLKEHGSVSRGWFGITMSVLTKDMAEALELDKPQGALINEVHENGPAEQAGLEPGDVIVAIADKPVTTMSDLSHIVGNTSPGSTVSVEVIREGSRKVLDLKVGNRGEAGQLASFRGGDKLGLEVEQIDDRTRIQLRLRGGVVVTSVAEESPAALIGLQPGDVIERIGRVRITSLAVYENLLPKIPEGKRIPIRIFRNGRSMFSSLIVE